MSSSSAKTHHPLRTLFSFFFLFAVMAAAEAVRDGKILKTKIASQTVTVPATLGFFAPNAVSPKLIAFTVKKQDESGPEVCGGERLADFPKDGWIPRPPSSGTPILAIFRRTMERGGERCELIDVRSSLLDVHEVQHRPLARIPMPFGITP